MRSASAVPIPKLSFVRLMSPELFFMVSASHSCIRPVKMIVSPAMFFNFSSSGPEPIIRRGNLSSLKSLMMTSHSLTKLTSLPTQTKYGFGVWEMPIYRY